MKLDFTFNTNISTTLSIPATGLTYNAMATSGNAPTCPYMISPLGPHAPAVATSTGLIASANAQTPVVSIQIAKNTYGGATASHNITCCRIYVTSYTLSPIQEEDYLKSVPQKIIKFGNYVYSNTGLTNIKLAKKVFNTQLFMTQPKVRSILLIPQISSVVHGGTIASLSTEAYAAGVGSLGSPMVSPFSSSPGTCCPYARVSELNVFVGNTPWFYQDVTYGWERYNNEILKSKTPFGNAIRGFGGGLLDQHAWETNHGYIYVSLDRWESKSADNVPKTIGIKFTNASNITCDYHCFLIYEDEINLNTSTGQLIL